MRRITHTLRRAVTVVALCAAVATLAHVVQAIRFHRVGPPIG